ncbi:molybdopterin-synthase adenylyltransferase MoeB [Arthrobacter sp. zg-Y820]|uniref:molybdopterin-synthase adenylyltransferase MoeB n=1 Tax=unclassified Arthrobacter TaxID=235627 RepID=UPI001E57C128|nr:MULTISPECIES: molybdopterin-synthase adenylyltransferase MoeB [unclassified Arthrobacter]MCC9195930.1 molybdopterin-synthase adenylyltransferase MoeB [Arthrobacter sp. zg-Y820]MDK1278789.1 molybdopterin-synthase adenylyltransferase MoeB [Arthrobacter sp. zg.Y820]MDK1359595.1 molybdopterin-synthase adenylyltransferase MoeB [Arthrobacter sp. zg-Y1219]WIB08791.1 molybdopterin-synthase adenylyltransferase MoeB [Arthrobacter sp. zg-Y820]
MTELQTALPPLVEPAAGLTGEETLRYSRHLILPEFGMQAQQRLKNARVLVIGAGGLGSPALLYLAAAGVGTLGILDDDTVEASNLQRQVIHGVSDVGSSKAESARRSVLELNPLVEVRLHPVRLDASNAVDIFAGYDLILDGTDNFATRYLVNDAAEILGKPYVWGSILRFDGQVSVFWGKHGPTYRDLYPEAPPPGSVPSCAEGGVLGVLCAQIGAVMVNEAVKLITGTGVTLLGRVLVLNALDMVWREIRVRKDPAAVPVTELIDYEAFCGLPEGSGAGRGSGAQVPAVGVHDLQRLLAARLAGARDFDLLDVREPGEHAIVSIDGALLMPRAGILSGENLPERGRELYVHCKSGVRSAEVAAFLLGQGYTDVFNVSGGILEWVREIEPAKPVY